MLFDSKKRDPFVFATISEMHMQYPRAVSVITANDIKLFMPKCQKAYAGFANGVYAHIMARRINTPDTAFWKQYFAGLCQAADFQFEPIFTALARDREKEYDKDGYSNVTTDTENVAADIEQSAKTNAHGAIAGSEHSGKNAAASAQSGISHNKAQDTGETLEAGVGINFNTSQANSDYDLSNDAKYKSSQYETNRAVNFTPKTLATHEDGANSVSGATSRGEDETEDATGAQDISGEMARKTAQKHDAGKTVSQTVSGRLNIVERIKAEQELVNAGFDMVLAYLDIAFYGFGGEV